MGKISSKYFANYINDNCNREYFPQNIMHDRRIMRGSTYAAMVIPAGTNPDAMVMEKTHHRARTFGNHGETKR